MRRVALCLLPVALASSACGYALKGRVSNLPAYITTIGVPPFINKSATPDIDHVFNQAVQTNFQSHGQYKITSDETGVDAVLRVTISSVSSTPTAFDSSRQASTEQVIVTADVQFIDTHTGKAIYSNSSVQVTDSYNITNSTSAGDVNAYFGQNQDALQRLATAFARQVVSAILQNF